MKRLGILLLILLFILTGCKIKNFTPKSEQEITKEHVEKFLRSHNGKDLLVEILTEDNVKEDLFINSEAVEDVFSKLMTTEKQRKVWTTLFKDPDFQIAFSKSMSDEHKKLFKQLIIDPDFQFLLIEMLDDPEVTEQVIRALKSRQFRSYLIDVINLISENENILNDESNQNNKTDTKKMMNKIKKIMLKKAMIKSNHKMNKVEYKILF